MIGFSTVASVRYVTAQFDEYHIDVARHDLPQLAVVSHNRAPLTQCRLSLSPEECACLLQLQSHHYAHAYPGWGGVVFKESAGEVQSVVVKARSAARR